MYKLKFITILFLLSNTSFAQNSHITEPNKNGGCIDLKNHREGQAGLLKEVYNHKSEKKDMSSNDKHNMENCSGECTDMSIIDSEI